MILTINIPEKDIPKMQFIMDISLHFLDGQLVEYTAPSGWDIEKQKSCEDCISREDALMALTGQCADSPIELLPKAIKQINALPPVTLQPKQRWIPVSERYPTDTNKCYLVCYEDGCRTIEYLYFDGDGYPFFSKMELGVVAWMPLPEPYKEREQE